MKSVPSLVSSLVFTTICFFLSIVSCAASKPAGIVLYYKSDEKVYLLLADDVKQERGWSAYGGGADIGETSLDTACRETEEETRGFFSRKWLKKQLTDQKPFTSFGYHMYFVEVPFTPALRIQNNPLKDKTKETSLEKTNFAWIPYSDFLKSTSKEQKTYPINPLFLPKSTNVPRYWNIWVRNMKAAEKQGALPWQKKN